MGQAKQRGTFQQRQAEGIAKRRKQEIERLHAISEDEARLTPEQRRKQYEVLAILHGLGVFNKYI
jgi:hypothetical protein